MRPLLSGYSTAEIAKLLGTSPARVRALVADGALQPQRDRGHLRFTFQDIVLLRAAQGLLAAKLPARRVAEALRRLRAQLPRGRSLAQVRISAEGSRVVVRDGAEAWEPASGQAVMDFEVADLAQRAAPLARRNAAAARRREDELDADDWFELALELEAAAPTEARQAYASALALDPSHADAHLNLGRLLHEDGDPGAAERHYRTAAALRPDDGTAAFNLGVALEDLRRAEEAIAAYQRALVSDPGFADAYFNLSGVYEKLGRKALALRHLKTYKLLTRGPR